MENELPVDIFHSELPEVLAEKQIHRWFRFNNLRIRKNRTDDIDSSGSAGHSISFNDVLPNQYDEEGDQVTNRTMFFFDKNDARKK
jgi:hypothetical protein